MTKGLQPQADLSNIPATDRRRIPLLEGKTLNLKIIEKEDMPQFTEMISSPTYVGEYNPLAQMSKAEMEKAFEDPSGLKPFFIEKKDGTKVGFIVYFHIPHIGVGAKLLEIGYSLAPGERGKGYGAEAINLMVDFLFLSRETLRIQAQTDARNVASQRVLEKVGFKKEGTLRKCFFIRGDWRDVFIYSILREEWKAPKVLKA
jgi:RimJ/RimL family protein N-acetyltransferase